MAFFLDDEEQSFAKPYFCSTYLDSPILSTPRSQSLVAFYKLQNAGCTADLKTLSTVKMTNLSLREKQMVNLLKERSKPPPANLEILDPEEYPGFIAESWHPSDTCSLEIGYKVSSELYRSAIKGLDRLSYGERLPLEPLTEAKHHSTCSDNLDRSQVSQREYILFSKWLFFDRIVQTVAASYGQSKKYAVRVPLPSLGPQCQLVTNTEVLLIDLEGFSDTKSTLLMTWDQLLMIKDLLYMRASVFACIRAVYKGSESLYSAVNALLLWQERCLIRHGNGGYEILKQTEALSKAYLSLSAQDEFGADGPYPRMVEKVRVKERNLGTKVDFLAEQFSSICELCSSTQEVTELFGLMKMTGHPLIDPTLGGKSAAHEARTADKTTYHDAIQVKHGVMRIFTESYIKKHGMWPKLIFPPRKEGEKRTQLHSLYLRQARGIRRGSYPLSDWTGVRFEKCLDFNFVPNYLELMDDKAISHYRSNIAANWDKDIKPISNRRLLLEMINREEISAREVVYKVMRREIPFDWLIICLYPKERELKLTPRMFSMLVFEIRLFFTLTEANLADSVFPYFPQQTMTKDRLEVSRKFLQLTRPIPDQEVLNMFLEIDLSRWNLRWRPLTIDLVGDFLDEIFGMPGVYTFGHTFFSECLVVVRTSALRPDGIELPYPPETDLVWYNHVGGLEGIMQKQWTLATYAIIDGCVGAFPVSYHTLGQADNQILFLRWVSNTLQTRKEQLIHMRDQLLDQISHSFSDVGQEVKPEECLESTSVITYSKEVYIDGVFYPTTLKSHSRLFPHSSQDFPSVRSNVGAIFSTSVAAAERSADPLMSYYLALLHSAIYLSEVYSGRGIYGPVAKREMRGLDVDLLIESVLTIPSECGGYPILGPTDYIYKGGSDPLNKALSNLMIIRSGAKTRIADRVLASMHLESTYKKEPDPADLIRDPYSLPINAPTTAVDGIADSTIQAIRGHIRTRDIYELVSADVLDYETDVINALKSMKPFNPLICHDILDCSVAGITETLKKMFVATRTIQGVARDYDASLPHRVIALEGRMLVYQINRFRSLPGSPWIPLTPYTMSSELRKKYWKEHNPEGITSYTPFDFRIEITDDPLQSEGVSAVVTGDPRKNLYTRGPYDPYVGSKTREKRSEHGYKIIGTDTTSESFRKLQLILSQSGSDESFTELIDRIGLSRSNTILSRITSLLTSVTGGTLSHRYAARSGYQDAYNIGSPNFFTHCLISSDNSGPLSGGLVDYNLMLQPCFLYLLWMLLYHVSRGRNVRVLILLTSETSLDPLPSMNLTVDPGLLPPIHSFPDNKLAFLDRLSVRKLGDLVGVRPIRVLPSSEILISNRRVRKHLLVNWFRTQLQSGAMARLRADSSSLLATGGRLDLAELVSAGVQLLIDSAATAVADEYVLDNVRTEFSHRPRWNKTSFVYKIAAILSSSFTFGIPHPLLKNDPAVAKYKLYDRPTYSSIAYSLEAQVQSAITVTALAYLDTITGSYYYDGTIVGKSTEVSELFRVVLCVFCKWLRLYSLKGEITLKQTNRIVSHHIMPIMRSGTNQDEKLLMLQASMSTLEKWLEQGHAYAAAGHLRAILNGRKIQGVMCSAQEGVRLLRSYTTLGSVPVPIARPRVHASCLGVDDYKVIFNPTSKPVHQNVDMNHIGYPITEQFFNDRISRHSIPQILSVGYSTIIWVQFSSIMKERQVLVIGVGQGAVASAALLAGSYHVFGVDLLDALPLRPHSFASYCPPAVREIGRETDFTLVPCSYTLGGDWSNPDVVIALQHYMTQRSLVVVDIEQGLDRSAMAAIAPLTQLCPGGEALVRLFLSSRELVQLQSILVASGMKSDVYLIHLGMEFNEYIVHLRLIPDHLIYSHPFLELVIPLTSLSTLDGTVGRKELVPNLLSQAVFCLIPAFRGLTLKDTTEYLLQLYREFKTDMSTRVSYREWTVLLRALTVVYWLSLPQELRVPCLLEWLKDGYVSLSIGGERVVATMDRRLASHLTGECARLLAC